MAPEISAEQVRELRDKTGVSMMECKKALVEASGDLAKANELLRKRGIDTAAKKAGRDAKEGRVYSYIHHNGKIGVLLELDCETDFVARNPEFEGFARDLALQVAANRPPYLSREQVPTDVLNKEKEIYAEQVKGKPEAVIEKIVSGKLEKFYADNCLLDQPLVKDPNTSVNALLKTLIAKLGENIVVRRFARFEVGGEL